MPTTITATAQETIDLGRQLASRLQGGEVICLHGELGAGKTTFTKGLAAALGVREEITSPTFTLMNVYPVGSNSYQLSRRPGPDGHRDSPSGSRRPGRDPELASGPATSFVHIDTYRLEDENELYAIGTQDYLGAPGTVTIVEWPEKMKALLTDKKKIDVYFEHAPGGGRKITIN